MLRTNLFRSFIYNALINSVIIRKIPIISKIWNTLWRWQVSTYKGLVKSKLHGQEVILTNGHWYSLVCRIYPKFNQPLFALVKAITDQTNSPIKVIDVGAAVGDTVLFLEANFPGKIGQYLCIDGDTEFFSFQEFNLKSVAHKSTNVFSLLSDKEELINTIDKTDPTTGSAIGKEKVMCKTLDQVILESGFGKPDVIKIDIDGFDGKAIGGARGTLVEHKPVVIFEWNTPLFNLVGNDVIEPFEILTNCGYNRFLWFTNLGDFSHFEFGFNGPALKEMEVFCQNRFAENGHHFDVIALHQTHTLSPNVIAKINEQEKKVKPY